jgi:hypothetical protein
MIICGLIAATREGMPVNSGLNKKAFVRWVPLAFPIAMLLVLSLNLFAFLSYQTPGQSNRVGSVYFPLRLIPPDSPHGWRPRKADWAILYRVQDLARGAEIVAPPEGLPQQELWRHIALVETTVGPHITIARRVMAEQGGGSSHYRMGKFAFWMADGTSAEPGERLYVAAPVPQPRPKAMTHYYLLTEDTVRERRREGRGARE